MITDRNGPLEAPTPLELGGLVVVTFAAAVAVLSLVLATVGAHEGWVALAGGTVVTVIAVAVAARRRSWSPAPWSWPAALALGAIVLLAAVQFFPGFPLAAKNRDPGVYVNHAVAIARQGDTTLTDPVAETGAELVVTDDIARIVTDAGEVAWRKLPYRSFPTDPDDPDHILPDFFHLWPATLATAYDLGGTAGLFNLTPLFAIGGVGLFFLATRRAFGLFTATASAGLLAVNELMVWQAKFPTAESLSVFFYAGALLAVALALSTRWRVAAALGGALIGVGFVARPEGIVVVALAAIVLAGLWVLERLDGRAWAFAAGLAPLLLLGTYQAYGRGSRYARLQQGLPSFKEAVAGAVLLVVLAVVARLLRRRVLAAEPGGTGLFAALGRRWAALDRERALRLVGYALVALFVLFLLVALFREDLLGQNYRIDKRGERSRGYDELNLMRLALFITPMALIAAVAALVVGVRARWSAARWVLVLPGLVIAPVLIWEPRIAPDLMWWGRRYVPMVVPTLLLLTAVCLAWLWERRGRAQVLRVGVALVLVAMGVWMLRQSSDLWGHEEFGGSLGVIEQLEAVADGEDAVFVWEGGSTMGPNFAITPFTWLGLPGLSGPEDPSATTLLALQEALGDRTLYLVADGAEPPPRAAGVLEEERRIVTELSEFEHGLANRPRRARPLPVDLTVWRLVEDEP